MTNFLAKFRKEAGDDSPGCSRNRNTYDVQTPPNLGKIMKENGTPSDFLGLGIDESSNYEINHERRLIIAPNPTPLSSFQPKTLLLGCSSSSSSSDQTRMREENKRNFRPRRRRADEYPEPSNPPQELVQRVGPDVRPVFLYRKQLSEWDTRKDQNRLFVNDRKKLMDFLTEEERLAVEDPQKPGTDIVGIDRLGTEYEMRTNKWESLDKAVVNRGWHEILEANGAEKGDWVHLWAFRRHGVFCMYVDFRHRP